MSIERFLAGQGTYLGTSQGNRTSWDPEGNARALEEARGARIQYYSRLSGPVVIEALNVDSAVNAQRKLTGRDLKSLSWYADYLRSEVSAATQARSDAAFVRTWGRDRVTNDVSEYIGWLFQAAQLNSPSRPSAEGSQPAL